MQRTEETELQAGQHKSRPLPKLVTAKTYEDEEMHDHQLADKVMMSMGPPSFIDTSSIDLSTRTNDAEILRMIQQYLADKGYNEIASQLSRESNVKMEEASVLSFRQRILEGDFDNVSELVQQLLTCENGMGESENVMAL